MKEDLLQVAARGPEGARPALQILVARAPSRGQFERGAPDPAIDRIGVEPIEAEEKDAVGDLGADAREFLKQGAGLLDRRAAERVPVPRISSEPPGRAEHVGGAKADPQRAKVWLADGGESLRRRKRSPVAPRDRIAPSLRHSFHASGDLPHVRCSRTNKRDERFPRRLPEEAHAEEPREAGDRAEPWGVGQVRLRVFVESEVADDRFTSGVAPKELHLKLAFARKRAYLGALHDAAPGLGRAFGGGPPRRGVNGGRDRAPAKRLPARKREREVEGTIHGDCVTARLHPTSVAAPAGARQAFRSCLRR